MRHRIFMAAIIFFGYFFLGCGPPIVFYCFFIAFKSFLVLLSLFRCTRSSLPALPPHSSSISTLFATYCLAVHADQ